MNFAENYPLARNGCLRVSDQYGPGGYMIGAGRSQCLLMCDSFGVAFGRVWLLASGLGASGPQGPVGSAAPISTVNAFGVVSALGKGAATPPRGDV